MMRDETFLQLLEFDNVNQTQHWIQGFHDIDQGKTEVNGKQTALFADLSLHQSCALAQEIQKYVFSESCIDTGGSCGCHHKDYCH